MGIRRTEWLDWFYYLAPLWLAVEVFVWPNFRAGAVVGGGLAATVVFYAVEGGIGAALWYRLPYAGLAALGENVVYLVLLLKFILLSPWDMALALADDAPGVAGMGASYAAALPGALVAMVQVGFRLKRQLPR
ncbi:MAG: hypothetical protein CVT66_10915 [Actinobacteria bacterium HGW-Actinobacteria-6]|nr:MAG: hypothetical protein CVT66_10915 [Actinobacteria bacterium HGW-Actinobacteria-6]